MKINYLTTFICCNLLCSCADYIPNNNIDVYISNGKSMCQDNALSISITKGYLLDADITVVSQSCGYLTQLAFPQVCGGETGALHIFTIAKSDAMLAENIGFTLPDNKIIEDSYQKIACND